MKNFCLLSLFLFIINQSFAQNNLAWAEEFGGTGVTSGSVIQLDDAGNSYMAGSYPTSGITFGSITLPGAGGENSFITKFDLDGNPLWATRCRRIGGFDDQDNPDKLAIDASGNVYIVGIYLTDATIGSITIPGDFGYFIAKLNNAGVAQWVKTISSPDNINAATISIFSDSQQQLNVLGLYNTSITFDDENTLLNTGDLSLGDAFLAKYDTSGNVLSTVELGTLNPVPFNPFAGFVPEFFRIGGDGNFYRLVKNGTTIKKYDANGALLLTKTLNVTGDVSLSDLTADANGNIFLNAWYLADITIEGESYNCQLDGDEADAASVFVKLDAEGYFQWGHSVVTIPATIYNKIRTDAIGNVYLAGSETVVTGIVSLLIAKHDPNGILMWNEFIYPNNIPEMIFGEALTRNIVLAADGGNILFMGYYKRYLRFTEDLIFESTATTWRIFLAQYGLCDNTDTPLISSESTTFCQGDSLVLSSTSAAAYLWSTGDTTDQITVNTPGDYHVYAIENGECYQQSATLHIEELPLPDAGISQSGSTLTANGPGTYQWINCDNNEPIENETAATFTPVESGTYAVIVTNENACTQTSECISMLVSGLDDKDWKNTISLYPNPATNEITITSLHKVNAVSIINLLGQTVHYNKANTIDVSTLSSGVYVVIVETQLGQWSGKFVKE